MRPSAVLKSWYRLIALFSAGLLWTLLLWFTDFSPTKDCQIDVFSQWQCLWDKSLCYPNRPIPGYAPGLPAWGKRREHFRGHSLFPGFLGKRSPKRVKSMRAAGCLPQPGEAGPPAVALPLLPTLKPHPHVRNPSRVFWEFWTPSVMFVKIPGRPTSLRGLQMPLGPAQRHWGRGVGRSLRVRMPSASPACLLSRKLQCKAPIRALVSGATCFFDILTSSFVASKVSKLSIYNEILDTPLSLSLNSDHVLHGP